MISPSAGMLSPASTSTMSPLRRLEASTGLIAASRLGCASFLAWISVRAFRSESACALPRPSAIASAKLAKRTVNHSQSEMARMNLEALALAHEPASARFAQDAADLDNEHDGVAHLMARGSSLRKESTIARRTIGGSKSARSAPLAVRRGPRGRQRPHRHIGLGRHRRRARAAQPGLWSRRKACSAPWSSSLFTPWRAVAPRSARARAPGRT